MDNRQIPIDSPIPGMGMTAPLGGRPWQQPPQLATVEDAMEYYMSKLSDRDFVPELLTVMELGVPLTTLANTMQLASVMEGKHSIDIGLLIAPVLHELILATARDYGINVKELPVSENERIKKREAEQVRNSVMRDIELGLSEDESLEESMVSTDEGAENAPQEQEEMPEMPEKGKGLMARSG